MELARFVAEWCERAGLETTLSEPAPGSAERRRRRARDGGGRSLMLNAHMDTVGVAGMTRPFVPRLDGGRLYGRGSYDMKGSLAACMLATAEAKRRGLRGDVILTAVADEEFASVGTEAVARRSSRGRRDRHRADRACRSPSRTVASSISRSRRIGRAAHGSRPHLGIDAIAKMGRVLVGIEELDRRLRANPTHPYVGSGSVHASLIEGGQEFSSYPARCVATGRAADDPGRDGRARGGRAPRDRRRRRCGRLRLLRRPFARSPRGSRSRSRRTRRSWRAVRRRAAAVLGAEPELVGVSFWADSALLAGAGIPTVALRPARRGRARRGRVGRRRLARAVRRDLCRRRGRALRASARGTPRSPRRSPRARPRAPSARRGRRDLEQVAERGAVCVEQVVVREVRALAEDEQRRDAHVLEARRRRRHLAVRGDDGRLAVAVAEAAVVADLDVRARGPRRRARAARSGAGSRRSAARSARRRRRTTSRARVLRCGECDVAGEEDRGIEEDELRARASARGPRARRRAGRRRSARSRTDSRAPTVSTIASTCAPMSHGGSQGEWPWPSRSGARTW